MGAEVDLSTITMAADTTVSFVDADNSANNKSYKFIAGATNNAAGFYTDGVSTPLANFSGLGLATDDKVTITIDGDASSFTVGSADKAAGLYEDGDNTKAALATGTITATSEMEINVADSENNGKTVKVGDEKTAAGYYDDDDNALPEDIAAGSEVEITPAGGEAQEFTVADLSSGKINTAGALDLMKAELEAASSIGAAKQAATAAVETDGTITITQGKVDVKDGLSFGLHVGADADMTNKIRVDIDSMSAAGLGVVGLNVKDATGMAATYAIDAIQDAIQKVSTQRSALGAVQNRLEHTIANLDNVVENTTAAESQIRDTDMASEMVKYSNNNILAQAGTSMLAQANQSNQNILSLLG
ncbi:MAG: flagellar hook protein [Lachnospiraceae bacterium]|nr:flagellar hook protein [Lachnospiraceae bacterium]